MQKLCYKLKGLDCANCAAKIQENVNKLNGVEHSELIFALQKLNVTISNESEITQMAQDLKDLIASIEPDVEVFDLGTKNTEDLKNEDSRKLKHDILILISSSILFIIGLIFKFQFLLELTIFAASYIIVGGRVVLKAFRNALKGELFDENFLMTIATLGAFAISEFPEAAAVMLFYRVGQMLEGMAVNTSRKSIKSLMNIRPDYANLKTAEGLQQVDPDDIEIGNIIIVKPGEKVPLDGIVTDGNSAVDTSALTGESIPRDIKPGENILSGFININGLLTVQVTKVFSQSTVSRILDLVQNAASKKARTESFITRFAKVYTPSVVAGALFLAVLPPLVTGSFEFTLWINRALIFLVISCPCALVISVPLSFFGGIGGASRRGILIKGSNYLEALNNIRTVVFDKTGTLTKGVFKVTEIVTMNGYEESEILELAALAEAQSNHPIAKSIVDSYSKSIDQTKIQSYEEIPGHGVKAVVEGKVILAGNDRLLHIGECIEHDTCNVQGTVIHVAVDNKYAGYLIISDEVKEDSEKAISELRGFGEMRIAMLTGDSEQSARNIANKLKIDEYYSELLPHQKVEKLEMIRQNASKFKLAFVGDGINDAPVLAMADVGIAMGGLGSDAAIEAADVVLMTDEPYKLVEAIKIARMTRSIVWQNIIFAFGVKLIVMILGAGGVATMWEAVFADVGVTLIAVFNSLRIMRK